MKDQFGREINYLRLGVTDRCNLRCRYCMPEQGIDFSKRDELLSYEEIMRLALIFRDLGVRKIRITGGEPFVRKDIQALISQLAKVFDALHITTNASLLKAHLDELQRSRVAGLNISLDSLDAENFFRITRRDQFDLIMDNLLECKKRAIPIKLNVVVMSGINDHELAPFIAFGREHQIEVRFIEAMPFNEYDGNRDIFLSHDEILARLRQTYANIEPIPSLKPSSAIRYRIGDEYAFAIIPAYTRSLCGQCNRLRMTPKGELLTCLYAHKGLSLRALLRDQKVSDFDIKHQITEAVFNKKSNGFEEEKQVQSDILRSMSSIGG